MARPPEDWEPFEGEDTVLEDRTPVPEAVPETATTGRYGTLSGFEKAAAEEISGARDLLRGRDQVFTAFRLWLIFKGASADGAQLRAEELRRWLSENEELVRVTMKDGG